ncbi:dead end protein 1 isoform X1 [Lepisosteus oculatus]|uniref:dead end protein 1 isoform X1 n=1 Tax=Lepisosteus oculatus TaxID=7918 RepID=UPI0035F503D5
MESTTDSSHSILNFVNKESWESLQAWKNSTGVSLVQINGQRIYGGPPADWRGPAPPHGCEVFISNIPRDVFEDKLIPLFEKVGQLYEFRLMMNFSGQNRGFAFAKYANPQTAQTAVLWLHHYELQKGCHITVVKSIEKRKLFVAGLPRALERSRVQMALHQMSEGVKNLTIISGNVDSEDVSATVEYFTHHSASLAKKVICEGFKMMFGISVRVEWWSQWAKSKAPPAEAAFPYSKACPVPARLLRAERQPAWSSPRAARPALPSPLSGSGKKRLSCFTALCENTQPV